MKITLCGSIAFYKKMELAAAELKTKGHEVKMPPNTIKDAYGRSMCVIEYYKLRKQDLSDTWIRERKKENIFKHFQKIEWCDCVLVLNYEKNGIEAYVGANTLMEMGLAFYLKKPIYLWDKLPDMAYKEEIVGMDPILINKDLYKIK